MKSLTVYLDTSVIGGVFDDEFSVYSKALMDRITSGDVNAFVSDITISEISKAPDFVRDFFDSIMPFLVVLKVDDEVLGLAESYLKEKIVGKRYFEDSLHIACATVHNLDVLLSWNFKHIVNLNKIVRFNAVNVVNGYKPLHIYSPMEV